MLTPVMYKTNEYHPTGVRVAINCEIQSLVHKVFKNEVDYSLCDSYHCLYQ